MYKHWLSITYVPDMRSGFLKHSSEHRTFRKGSLPPPAVRQVKRLGSSERTHSVTQVSWTSLSGTYTGVSGEGAAGASDATLAPEVFVRELRVSSSSLLIKLGVQLNFAFAFSFNTFNNGNCLL